MTIDKCDFGLGSEGPLTGVSEGGLLLGLDGEIHVDLSEYDDFVISEWIERFRKDVDYECEMQVIDVNWRSYFGYLN